MTGRIGIPSNVKQELDHLEPQFMGKTCLADRKFAYWLSFMKFSALSPQPREFADGVRMVVFKPQGEISEKVKRHNGHVEIATMSAAIVLYYADPTDQVVIDKKGIRVPVDTHKAYDLIVAARQRRFEAAKAETVETVSPVLQQIAIKSVSHQEMPLIPSDRVKHSGRAKPTDPNQALLPL